MSLLNKIKELCSQRARDRKWAEESHPFDTTIKIDGVDVAVGRFTYGAGNIQLAHHHNSPPLRIGRFCSIAGNVKIFTGAYHRLDWLTTYPFGVLHQGIFGNHIPSGFPHSNGGVTIGSDVWIGNSATIMSGVAVGDGAVIAAGSHVVRDVAPYEVVGGNPAARIKFRFPDDVVAELLRIKWWDLEIETIKKIHRNLTIPGSSESIDALKNLLNPEKNP